MATKKQYTVEETIAGIKQLTGQHVAEMLDAEAINIPVIRSMLDLVRTGQLLQSLSVGTGSADAKIDYSALLSQFDEE